MAAFRQIELFLGESYSQEEGKAFICKSRCICNYVERAISKSNFDTTLSRVNVYCSKNENEVRIVPGKDPPFLHVYIMYDLPPVTAIDNPTLQNHYAQIIELGLRNASDFMPVPLAESANALRNFKEGGYKNEWICADKMWKRHSIRSVVKASLTTERFTLWQYVFQNDKLIAKTQAAATIPREFLFAEYMGKLSMDRSGNIVYKRNAKVLTKFNVDQGKFVER